MNFNNVFLIPIIICFIFILIASYYDLNKGIIPNKLNLFLLIFGLIFNIFISFLINDFKIIFYSIIFTVLTFSISYFLWKLEIWGGGDVKLFTSISASIPTSMNLPLFTYFSSNLILYPFSISLIINSILVSFPILVIFLIYTLIKNPILPLNKKNIHIFLNLNNLRIIIKENLNKNIDIKNLKEGMVINSYYFNNSNIYKAINENNGNLKCYINQNNPNYPYYFKSKSIAGITFNDLSLLKIFYAQKFIKNNISVKIAFPFAPSILCGYTIAILFGDLSLILLNILKNIIFVIL